ncbi:hypothetical protein FA13DRAFT_1738236 [Coprinellus micaceus]|uniref:BHLH domain-containing protein n=1 Tax=Coprinellus micaceus TaxID=71717 RepID=A0A4Y7SWA9_COPMI|nr:hypothetical protein FA13DRAFT_1738236 [Coprinellus micaceus]
MEVTSDDAQAPPPAAPAPGPAKRGRKPGPLSRAAREAQRRLNHSIIEKARRTKINDALATLKEMVPTDYAQAKSPTLGPVDSEGEEDVDEYQLGSSSKSKKAGKKPEKEKEFKLEILVRTVAYMKDLIGRVSDLEKEVGEGGSQMQLDPSQMQLQTRKRPRSRSAEDLFDDEVSSRRPRRDSYLPSDAQPRLSEADSSSRASTSSKSILNGPLPPISSWLPESVALDPRLRSLNPAQSPQEPFPYLPSPPSSTHFEPIRTSYLPPTLSLASMSMSSMNSSSAGAPSLRTPEDETAANLLIQMSTSPPSKHAAPTPPPSILSSSSSASTYSEGARSNSSSKGKGPAAPSRLSVERRPHWKTTSERFMAQTPASLLGLGHIWMPEH